MQVVYVLQISDDIDKPVAYSGEQLARDRAAIAAHDRGVTLEPWIDADDGSFISGTFADYLLPTTAEVPAPLILHFESPSPFTPLGAKGVGEGNCMSTPVCIANAVADALGVTEVDLPLAPAKLAALIRERA